MGVKLLLLALAGALGTLVRYGLTGLIHRWAGAEFPWGTLAVNMLGCFLAGLLWSWSEYRLQISGQARLVILMGFLGAFTTFSTFMLETGQMIQTADWLRSAVNLLLQNSLGFFALFSGLFLGRVL